MEIATNYTYQRLVNNGGSLPPDLLDGPFKTFHRITNNLEDALNNSSNTLFGVCPLSYIEKHNKRKPTSPYGLSDNQKRSNNGIAKGWLVCPSGHFSFPKNLARQPCKKIAVEGLDCPFGRTCRFDHEIYPKGFHRIDQAILCDFWTK